MSTKITPKDEKPTKFERIFEDEECISIWKYDLKRFKNGPVEVEYKWKRSFNPWKQKKMTLGDMVKPTRNRKTT